MVSETYFVPWELSLAIVSQIYHHTLQVPAATSHFIIECKDTPVLAVATLLYLPAPLPWIPSHVNECSLICAPCVDFQICLNIFIIHHRYV